MEEIENQKEQMEREDFVKGLRFHVEGLYSQENKNSIEDVDKEKVIQDFKKKIEEFCEKNNIKKEEIIAFALEVIDQVRKVNPNSKAQYNLIEESLYDILYEGQDFDDGTFDL